MRCKKKPTKKNFISVTAILRHIAETKTDISSITLWLSSTVLVLVNRGDSTRIRCIFNTGRISVSHLAEIN